MYNIFKKPEIIEKGWGKEIIYANHELYCLKLLVFNPFSEFSMHFHAQKHESWVVWEGTFELEVINTDNAEHIVHDLTEYFDNIIVVRPLLPHKIRNYGRVEGRILEVSTFSRFDDNFRILAGDSQNK